MLGFDGRGESESASQLRESLRNWTRGQVDIDAAIRNALQDVCFNGMIMIGHGVDDGAGTFEYPYFQDGRPAPLTVRNIPTLAGRRLQFCAGVFCGSENGSSSTNADEVIRGPDNMWIEDDPFGTDQEDLMYEFEEAMEQIGGNPMTDEQREEHQAAFDRMMVTPANR